MTSVLITQAENGVKFVDVNGQRLSRVLSVRLEVEGGVRFPVVQIIQHDDAYNEITRTLVPTTFELRQA